MIHEELNKLIPFVSENCITYPLWEEGLYIPFLNFWKLCETADDVITFNKRIKEYEREGYKINVELPENRSKTFNISISPEYFADDGWNKFKKPNWSIEEMVEVARLITKQP